MPGRRTWWTDASWSPRRTRCFFFSILQQIRKHVPAEVYLDVKRALDNIAVRSRHVGTELIRVAKTVEKA